MLNTLSRRLPVVEVLLAPSAVQGVEAPPALVKAIQSLTLQFPEVIIIARGGGSIEDLWAFNEEAVVRAIARSPVPAISAVGHETDVSLADLVADHRAPTPTAAAQVAVPDRVELLSRVASIALRLRRADAGVRESARQEWRIAAGKLADPRPLLQGKRYAAGELSTALVESGRSLVRNRRDRVERLASTVRLHSPAVRVSGRRGEVAVLVGRARAGIAARGSRLRFSLTVMAGKLSALDPKAVLARGFAIAVDRRTGKAVRSVTEARPGQPIDVQVSDGSFGAVVEGRKP